MWGDALDDVFAVGLSGTVMRFDGRRWLPERSGTERGQRAAWVAADGGGTVVHRPGEERRARVSGTVPNDGSA
ncbi:MAG: hypothetical protein V3R98_13890 [Alphaproteobacteria bacterium]